MKTLVTMLALAMGTAALAQDTQPPPAEPMEETAPDTTTPDTTTPAPTDPTTPAPADPATPEPTQQTDPAAPAPAPAPMQEPMQQPMQQPMAPAPGQQVIVNPSPPVNQAFPPPPPKAEYPVCSRTVTDGCVQRRGSPRPPGSPRTG